MHFEAESYLDEYVIDGANSGTFAGDDASVTYTPDDAEMGSPVAIPTDEIASITFKRNTTLCRNRLLGWFFAGITLLLLVLVYLYSFAGRHTDPTVDFISFFLGILFVGGLSTTYEYINGENHDVIVISISTDDDDRHVFAGRVKNAEFVDACGELIGSDIETRNRNTKLDSILSGSQ